MKGLFRRGISYLDPVDEDAVRIMFRTKIGEFVKVDAVVPRDQRSVKMHRLFHKTLQEVFDNLPETWRVHIPTVRHLRMRIFLTIGFTETVMTANGPHEVPRSMAFSLGQDEFHRRVWDPTMDLIAEKILPGVDRKELEQRFWELMG